MVEIIPYEEDDEDSSLWVPLSIGTANDSAPRVSSASADTHSGDTTTSCYSQQHNYAQHDGDDSANNYYAGNGTEDDADDVDQEWEELLPYQETTSASSSSREEQSTTQIISQSSSSTAAPSSLGFWEKQLISRLTSTTTATTNTTFSSSASGIDERCAEEDDESSEGEEDNIHWRPISNEEDDNDASNSSADTISRKSCRSVKESDNDLRHQPNENQSHNYQTIDETDNIHISNSSSNFKQQQQTREHNPNPANKSHHQNQQSKPNTIPQRTTTTTNNNNNHHHHQSPKSKLQQKLLHDPLRALPLTFLRHFLHQLTQELHLAWTHYLQTNELSTILAPLALVVLLSLLGVALITRGVVGLHLFVVVPTFVQVVRWMCLRMVDCIWSGMQELVRISVGISLMVGLGIGVWFFWAYYHSDSASTTKPPPAETETTANSFVDQDAGNISIFGAISIPTISTLLPWVVALTSASVYESLIVLFSIRTCLSIFFPDGQADALPTGSEGCVKFDHEDSTCSMNRESYQDAILKSNNNNLYILGRPSTYAICTMALLIAMISFVVISIAAHVLEQKKEGSTDNSKTDAAEEESSNDAAPISPSSTSDSNQSFTITAKCFVECVLEWLSTTFYRVQSHLSTCHTVAIITLAIMSLLLSIMQTLYVQYLRDGGSLVSSLLNGVGSIGSNLIFVSLGFLVFYFLLNQVTSIVTVYAFTSRISCHQVTRIALKESLKEVSSNAVWSSGENNGGIRGILSEDDGTLRLAILEWLIDRWTMSSASSKSTEISSSQSKDGPLNPKSESAAASATRHSVDDNGSNASSNERIYSNFTNVNSGTSDYRSRDENHSDHQQTPPSYQSYRALQNVIATLDADETLIPTIQRYRSWVYSLPPSQNAAMLVALWKMCPATTVIGLSLVWCVFWWGAGIVICCFTSVLGRWRQLLPLLFMVKSDPNGLNDGEVFLSEGPGEVGCSGISDGFLYLIIGLAVISPVLLEYLRVRRWWAANVLLRSEEGKNESANGASIYNNSVDCRPNPMMILLESDSEEFSSKHFTGTNVRNPFSSFFLRTWILLVESIALLESSIPVVRCATVACAAANLANDTMCLLDLAVEIKNRGLVTGIGMVIWDAFHYHLSAELHHRKQDRDNFGRDAGESSGDIEDHADESAGGQYTGAVKSAFDNFGKMSRNIGCLVDTAKMIPPAETSLDEGDTNGDSRKTRNPCVNREFESVEKTNTEPPSENIQDSNVRINHCDERQTNDDECIGNNNHREMHVTCVDGEVKSVEKIMIKPPNKNIQDSNVDTNHRDERQTNDGECIGNDNNREMPINCVDGEVESAGKMKIKPPSENIQNSNVDTHHSDESQTNDGESIGVTTASDHNSQHSTSQSKHDDNGDLSSNVNWSDDGDMSEVLTLISKSLEIGLITKRETDSFLEMILSAQHPSPSNVEHEENASNSTRKVLNSIRQTISCLEKEAEGTDCSKLDMEPSVALDGTNTSDSNDAIASQNQAKEEKSQDRNGIDDQDNAHIMMPALFGGGIALLGALVGGITIFVNNKREDEKKQSHSSNHTS